MKTFGVVGMVEMDCSPEAAIETAHINGATDANGSFRSAPAGRLRP